ncbi:hypothetical protein ASG82_19370 [Mycobacterium sp. Soil538]|nr:hypothetical protein ASG82_19370 [Mycobacterium sp. Soil538]
MAAIEVSHPPEVMLKTVNVILRRVLRTPLGRPLSEFMVLDFTGRKSGRHFSIPVSAHQHDGDLYAVLEAQWKYNFRDGADAQVSHGGNTTTMRGVLLTDTAAVADVVHRLASGYGAKKAQRMMGMKFTGDGVPTREEWVEAVDRLKIAAIKLTPKA